MMLSVVKSGMVWSHTLKVYATQMVLLLFCTTIGYSQDTNQEETIKPLYVMINTDLGQGTVGAGIIIGTTPSRIYIATANHVVRRAKAEAPKIEIEFYWLPGEKAQAILLPRYDPSLDLAILAVADVGEGSGVINIPILPFDKAGVSDKSTRGSNVYHIGNPNGVGWTINVQPDAVFQSGGQTIEFESRTITVGHSGGGLLNDCYQLIGMITEGGTTKSRALNVDRILEKAREWRIPVNLEASGCGELGQRDQKDAEGPILPEKPVDPDNADDVIDPSNKQSFEDTLDLVPSSGWEPNVITLLGWSNMTGGDGVISSVQFDYLPLFSSDEATYPILGIALGKIWLSSISPEPGEDIWPSENAFINDKISDATRFGDDAKTVDDLNRLHVEGELTYIMEIFMLSKRWSSESWYGTRTFAGLGWAWGDATIDWRASGSISEDTEGSFDYSVSGFALVLGAHLRVGSPNFSVLGSYQLFREPVGGFNHYLSAGLLWPF